MPLPRRDGAGPLSACSSAPILPASISLSCLSVDAPLSSCILASQPASKSLASQQPLHINQCWSCWPAEPLPGACTGAPTQNRFLGDNARAFGAWGVRQKGNIFPKAWWICQGVSKGCGSILVLLGGRRAVGVAAKINVPDSAMPKVKAGFFSQENVRRSSQPATGRRFGKVVSGCPSFGDPDPPHL